MTQNEIWERWRESIREKIGDRNFRSYLEPVFLDSIQDTPRGKTLKIGVPGPMYSDWLKANVLNDLTGLATGDLGVAVEVEVVVNATPQLGFDLNPPTVSSFKGMESSDALPQAPVSSTPRRDYLNPEYTFSTFVVGPGNQFAHAACHSVSEKPGKNVNPLFICGPSGTGKTHLLNAVGNAVKERVPHTRICYISGERFINDVVSHLRHQQMDKFRKQYRESYDFLIVDDIHVISRTQATQEEFFYTFNSFHDAGKQVIVASDKLPREMNGLEDRIRTRLEWGLTVDIQPPDVETRMAILRYKAEKSGVFMPDDVISMISQISKRSVRELEGNLATVRMLSELRGIPITIDLAKEVFNNVISQQQTGLSIEDIQRVVSEHYKVTLRDLKSESRVKTIVKPRQVAMYLTRRILKYGYVEIGNAFGNRDHTTVLHAESKIQNTRDLDSEFNNDISRLETIINNSQKNIM